MPKYIKRLYANIKKKMKINVVHGMKLNIYGYITLKYVLH